MSDSSQTDLAAWSIQSDPVHDSQKMFRMMLRALSEPGILREFDFPEMPSSTIDAALWNALLTLCDLDTPVWIAPELDSTSFRAALGFYTGAPVTDEMEKAAFAVLSVETFAPPYSSADADFSSSFPFNKGSDIYPDRSTTLLVQVPRLENSAGWQLRGPGIASMRELDIGDHAGCIALMNLLSKNRDTFPCGLDVMLTSGNRLTAIPRSTMVIASDKEVLPCM